MLYFAAILSGLLNPTKNFLNMHKGLIALLLRDLSILNFLQEVLASPFEMTLLGFLWTSEALQAGDAPM